MSERLTEEIRVKAGLNEARLTDSNIKRVNLVRKLEDVVSSWANSHGRALSHLKVMTWAAEAADGAIKILKAEDRRHRTVEDVSEGRSPRRKMPHIADIVLKLVEKEVTDAYQLYKPARSYGGAEVGRARRALASAAQAYFSALASAVEKATEEE